MNEIVEQTKNFLNSTIGFWIVVVIAVVGISYAADFIGSKDVSRDGVSADTVRNQIEQAGNNQRAISQELKNAESTVGNITGCVERSATAVGAAGRTAESIDAAIQEQRVLIGECQQILRDIRAGAKENAEKN